MRNFNPTGVKTDDAPIESRNKIVPDSLRMKSGIIARNAVNLVLIALIAAASACTKEGNKQLYTAEKSLFSARKMREKLAITTMNPEFFEKTIQSYRVIVNDYKDSIDEVEGLAEVVIYAQFELAELEYSVNRFGSAVEDFYEAYVLAETIPQIRANALYSAALISEQVGDRSKALQLYEKFCDEFLNIGALRQTTAMNTQYAGVPLKISELYLASGDENENKKWLGRAEEIYSTLIESGSSPQMVKEMQFNLLTTYLQSRKWNKALEKVRDLKKTYDSREDTPPLLFLEAMINRDGFAKSGEAMEIFKRIYEDYPDSREAKTALIAAGAMLFKTGRYNEAESLYERLIENYGEETSEAAEAAWQLAQIEEARGSWLDASLRYKSIYINYPGTIQGLEAPLRIAGYYKERNEREATESAYRRAMDHYRELVSSQSSMGIKVAAEEYIVRILAEQNKWVQAAEHLLELPDKYMEYPPFRQNYLIAASIYENELGRPDKSIEVLQICKIRYPGTDLAEEAEKHIERLKESK